MNPYATPQAYRQNSVLTASPGQLVVMLYDGAIRFLRQAELAMEEGAVAHTNDRMQRAEAILDELLATLNMDAGEISGRLQAIYTFCRSELIAARLERSPKKIKQVIGLLSDLREAWAEIAQAGN
ncbi:flagellar export chaperone FliS [Svornostia abyssi]|uniref:Flagellar export chaperone FliS n=1 Tax=Svornostia abyssi TaxID=2898438 RepID=A0ABY5PK59_9ACTN|nr:flagellar export chaperone FliS [Parviterribacteraceae bacterium J379]